jgi:hypothetical protein
MKMNAMSILGVVSPGTAAVAEPSGKLPLTKTVLPGVVLGVAGAMTNKRHPYLAFIGFESVGMNGWRLYRGQGTDRTVALTNMGQAAAVITGSLLSPSRPFWGGVAGLAAGVVAMSFVKGSNAHRLLRGGK